MLVFVSTASRVAAQDIATHAPDSLAITAPAPLTQSDAGPSLALLLDTGDLLDVQVFDTPELSGKLRVDDRGDITLPVGGAVGVKGLTAEQAQNAIERRFRERNILRDPHVDVLVLEYATQGVTVAGEVKTPGVYPWVGKHTVLDFVAVAGGVTPYASRTVSVTRRNNEQIISFQLGNSSQDPAGGDLTVEPGDRIVVARAGIVYVVGDVGRPGGYLIESRETITVLQALALARGINKTAKYDGKLIRNSPSGRTEADLPLKKILANHAPDPKLQDGDIVFVPVSGSKEWTEKGVTSILQMAVGVVIYGRVP
ncbi:MAG TPA: polysaccharide biosynthesis/export family protein [Candidatus Binatia bacterium]|nr:polysaccharide biosynthesis/export family protein [Candidatus Binatia bacterium]